MLIIGNSPKGFPFRYKIIDDSLTIIFDLACWLYVLATLWLIDMQSEMSIFRRLLAVYVCLLANI
jgi:hypothetical protein